MKWSFLAIVLLGLVAAVCVAGLMAFLPSYLRGPAVKTPKTYEVQVVVAKRDIPAMQIVDGESVMTKSVPRKEAPENCFSDSVQVLGKVLALPMVEGQAFTRACFAEGSGAHLAAAMPKGMRAVGVALSEHSGLFGVLYPGSRVDIMVAYKGLPAGEASSKTLLQNVQVLGIEGQTIVSPESDKLGRSDASRKRMVTVMVDPEQARSLESAMEQGTLSLAMRNPLDTSVARVTTDPPKLRPGPVTTAPAQQTWEMTILRNRTPEVRKFIYVVPFALR